MKAKVKKLFSETFVKTYDYPFIIGFLEANGINGIVPSFEQNENPDSVNIEYIIEHEDDHVAIDIEKVLDEFLEYNTKQAERFIFERPHLKGLEYFIRKHIVSDILD